MTIGKKIIGGYAVTIAALAVVAGVSYYALNVTQSAYSEFIDVREGLVDAANELRFETRDRIAHLRAFFLFPENRAEYLKELEQNENKFKAVIENMQALVLTDDGRGMVDELAGLNVRHWAAIKNGIALSEQGKGKEALAANIKDVRPLSRELVDKADAFRDRQVRLMTEGRADVTGIVDGAFIATGIVSFLGILAAALLSFFLARTITRTLRESTSQLSSSAAEIVAMTTQVAAGTSETATAVSETTTTVEEVKQTA
ncbi:MAG: MCP four helix bundle domain-containing protein, partial [Bacteroidota bacterium]